MKVIDEIETKKRIETKTKKKKEGGGGRGAVEFRVSFINQFKTKRFT